MSIVLLEHGITQCVVNTVTVNASYLRGNVSCDYFDATSHNIIPFHKTQVGMLQTYVQIVSTQHCPQRWGPDSVVWQAVRRSLPHGWLCKSGGQRKQRQYKPDWRCAVDTPTQNVTTPSTDNTTPHHRQTTTHPLTCNGQPKDKNIVILQININGIKDDITFTNIDIPRRPSTHNLEL